MSADSLLDTNIIIYLLDGSQPEKYGRAEQLVLSGLRERQTCISPQVLQETLNVATQRLNFNEADAKRLLQQTLLPLCEVVPLPQLYQQSLSIQARYRYSFYDSLIIAAALELRCSILYSEDLQHGQTIERLTIKNPFIY